MLLVLCVLAVVWAVVAALLAAHRLGAVRADLTKLRDHPPTSRAALDQRIGADLATLDSARGWLDQPGPQIVAQLPVVGRSWVAEARVTDAASAVVGAARTLAGATSGLSTGSSGVSLPKLAAARAALDRSAAQVAGPLRALAAVNTGLTPPQLGAGVAAAQTQLMGFDARLREGADVVGALAGVLGGSGPRTVLVALENNAELRGTGGLVSSYAMGTTNDGRFELGPFRDVSSVALPDPAHAVRVPAPPDYVADYGGYLANTTIWKNVTMSPDIPASSQVLSEVAAATIGKRPDVVVLLDVPGMARIVTATGPVTINGQPVTGDALTKALLVDAYGNGALDNAQQDSRRHELEQAADQAFQRIRGGAVADLATVTALTEVTAGRHLAIWSARPAEQAALTRGGAAGAVNPRGADVAMVTANNLGDGPGVGNKLDYYVDRSLRVDVTVGRTSAQVTQTVTLHNGAPAGLGPYVEGPNHPGLLSELLALSAARDARFESFTLDGRDQPAALTHPNGTAQVSTLMQLPRDVTATYQLRYRVPVRDGHYRLELLPQPLARPATLAVAIRPVAGETIGPVRGAIRSGDEVTLQGDWSTAHEVAVALHDRSTWEAIRHSIAQFWTSRVSV